MNTLFQKIYVYLNFYINTDCLSHGKYFGTIHMANSYNIVIAKLVLALLQNFIPVYLEYLGLHDKSILYSLIIINIVIYIYFAYNQIIYQPFYSKPVNNYKFAVYFSLALYSFFTFLICLLKINTSSAMDLISLIIILILFIIGYKCNDFYYNNILKRIYKKFNEKKMITNLKKATSSDELKYNPENFKKKDIYISLERIAKQVYIKKEIKVFRNYYECDIVYIMAWYYIFSMKKFYKNNNLLHKYDEEIFKADDILFNAKDLRLNLRMRFLLNKAENLIEIEKRENSKSITNNNNIESSIKLEELKHNAVVIHINGLKEIKELFNNLKRSVNSKDVVSYINNINNISKFQESAFSQYNNIIRHFADAKDVLNLYVLFLSDVMNRDDLAQSKKSEKSEKTVIENSLISIPHSDDHSSNSGLEKDLKRKINLKNTMIKKYITPIKSLKLRMTYCFILLIVSFLIYFVCTYIIFNFAKNQTGNIDIEMNAPLSIIEGAFRVRMLSFSLLLNNTIGYNKFFSDVYGTNFFVSTFVEPIILSSMANIESTQIFEPDGEYAYDSLNIKTVPETLSKYMTNLKYCINRVNSKSNFEDAFKECINYLPNKIMNYFDTLDIAIIIISVLMVLLVLMIAYIKPSTNKIAVNIFRTFRLISKDNFEEIISDYDEKINSLCENFEIDKEITDKSIKTSNKNKIIRFLTYSSFAIAIFVNGITIIPTINAISDVENLLKLLQKSASRLTIIHKINYFTYETIFQDRSVFVPNEPERILNDLISKLENIQEELKSGSYGGPTFDRYPSLNYILKDTGCHRLLDVCKDEDFQYDSSYGNSEELVTLPQNELINEYLYYVKSFLNNIKELQYIQLELISKENLEIMYNQVLNDNFFKLQDVLIKNIKGGIEVANYELIKYSNVILDDKLTSLTLITVTNVILLIFIYIFIFNKAYREKIKEMETLVSFAFMVPQQIINSNEKYKRFLETCQFDE
ncbi:hypothetical protein U3516DRAFT_805657 [Neocallimastix sp. 'constans']